ncbi:MAG: ABC transporter substrate-binding protein [Flavobacterium sp.]|nr:ABC transporter substrate-binding protein [Flavobacterium sp.]
MKPIRIAGVPEHFNLPWHLCIEDNEFSDLGIDLQWTDVPEGTGKLCQMLRNDQTDLAVVLTEGIVKDIIAGNPSKTVQIYVDSPLIWGVHVDAKSNYYNFSDLKHRKAAISRVGSGSQLMAYVNARNNDWDTSNLDFEIVHTIDGAVEALTEGNADYFMWERFMTKPIVDRGVFRRIGDCPTPWPCFVIAVREDFFKNHPHSVAQILEIINKMTLKFKTIPNIDALLAERYHQKREDIQEWLALTEWSQKQLTKEAFTKIQNELFELRIIDNKSTYEALTSTL